MTKKTKQILFAVILALAPLVFLLSHTAPINAADSKKTATTETTPASGAPQTMFKIIPIYKVLTPDQTNYPDTGFDPKSMGGVVAKIWQTMMNFVNSLVLIALIYVAFMNILRQKLDSYAVKKILPTFIMAVILANFSFLICRLLIDVGSVVISIFLTGNPSYKITGAFEAIIGKSPVGPNNFEGNYTAYIFAYTLKQLLVMVGAVMMFILSFIFMVRNFMIYFLVAISPMAFMAMILPVTSKYFQQWWSQMTKWIFMPVVSVFWLWLAGQFVNVVDPGGNWVLPLVFTGLCFYMAITSPLKAGDAVLGAWTKFGKQAWGKTGGAAWNATGRAGINAAKAGAKNYYDTQKDHVVRKIENTKYGKAYVRLRNKGQINRQVSQFMLEKQRSDVLRGDSLQKYVQAVKKVGNLKTRFGDDSSQAKEAERVVGRFKKILGTGVNDEIKNPRWKLGNLDNLKGAMVTNTRTGQLLKAEDLADPERVKRNFTFMDGRAIEAKHLEDNGIHLFEEHASAYSETMRRTRNTSLDDHEDAVALNLPILDARTMSSSAVPLQQPEAGNEVETETPATESTERPEIREPVVTPTVVATATETTEPQEGRNYRYRKQGQNKFLGKKEAEDRIAAGEEDIERVPIKPKIKTDVAPPAQAPVETPPVSTTAPPASPQTDNAELTTAVQELTATLENVNAQIGGGAPLTGEKIDQALANIAQLKQPAELTDAGIVAAILPQLHVSIERISPEAMRLLGEQARRTAALSSKVGERLERDSFGVLQMIQRQLRSDRNIGDTRNTVNEGKKALEEE